MNLKELVKDENNQLWIKLAEKVLDCLDNVYIFLNIAKDINSEYDLKNSISLSFNYDKDENEIEISHNRNYSPYINYKDSFIEEYFDESKIAKLAIANWEFGFCDGVVQFNYEDMRLYGCSFTTGEVENPANPVVELYRIKSTEECNICSCYEKCEDPETQYEECLEDTIVEEIKDNGYLDDAFDNIPSKVFYQYVAEDLIYQIETQVDYLSYEYENRR